MHVEYNEIYQNDRYTQPQGHQHVIVVDVPMNQN